MMHHTKLLLAGIPLLLTSSILAAVTPHKPATTQVAAKPTSKTARKAAANPAITAAQRDNFEQAIRPLLTEHCGGCHASSINKGGVILDTAAGVRAAALRLPAVLGAHGKPTMPPGTPLAETQRKTLIQWATTGAYFPEKAAPGTDKDWAFKGINAPGIPKTNNPWTRTAIDSFILTGLRKAGLNPQPDADRRTLIRRLSYDLIGLPPTPSDVTAFVNDKRPDAYELLVDNLLARPEYGQRWARHWLDVVRYADSQDARGIGGESDFAEAYKYRDWVVNAFNTDMPWKTFVSEQLAGDTRRDQTGDIIPDSIIATGWLAFGNWGNGDADKDKILTDIVDDQVDTVGKAFMGITIGCARCHNHKFDPISQRDYTALSGIFYSTHIIPKLTPKGAGEVYMRIPLETKASKAARAERDALQQQITRERNAALAAAGAGYRTLTSRTLRYIQGYLEKDPEPRLTQRWRAALGMMGSPRLPKLTESVAGIAGLDAIEGTEGTPNLLINRNPRSISHVTFTVDPSSVAMHPGPRGGVRLLYTGAVSGTFQHEVRVRDADPGCGDGITWRVVYISPDGKEQILGDGAIPNGGQQGAQVRHTLPNGLAYSQGHIALDILPKGEYSCDTTNVTWVIRDANKVVADVAADAIAGQTGNPFGPAGASDRWMIQDLAKAPGSGLPAELVAAFKAGRIDDATRLADSLPDNVHPATPWSIADIAREDREHIAALQAKLAQLNKALPPQAALAVGAQEGGVPESPHAGIHDVKVHKRGKYDDLGDLVPRSVPAFFVTPAEAPKVGTGSGRAELGAWLGDTRNLHVARVWMNRLWQHHFGQGIVRTPSNFGALGDKPSHPELLNWLAAEFQKRGQSTKTMHRLIVTSSVYRQQASVSAVARTKDPENRLLSHMNRRLLDAESLRDTWLAAGGILDLKQVGGPATPQMDSQKRTVYLQTVRSDRTSYRMLFDGADPTNSIEKRNVSIVAPQALYLLNSSFTDKVVTGVAARMAADTGTQPQRIIKMWEQLVGRGITAGERAALGDLWMSLAPPGTTVPDTDVYNVMARAMLCANATAVVD